MYGELAEMFLYVSSLCSLLLSLPTVSATFALIFARDTFDIYAILYETDDNVEYLDGTNSLTSPNIVMMARLEDKKESDEWVPFSIPFILKPGKSIDMDILSSGKYNFSIVLSSSIEGAYFNGAVGSTLLVDEMELTCDN